MELLQLKYFQTLARVGNVTHAANELCIAQPSLSNTIARLEKELGYQLFDRRGRRLHLNTFGEVFLKHVDRIFHELHVAEKELRELAGQSELSLTIGTPSARLLPNPLTEYIKENPYGKFRILQLTDAQSIQNQLLNSSLDFCLSFTPLEHPDIHCQAIATEEVVLAVAATHHLADKNEIRLYEAAEEAFISITTEYGFRELTDAFCQQAGFTPNVAFEINSLEIITNLVSAGRGVAFMPKYWYNSGRQSELPVQLKISEPNCMRSIWISWLKDGYMSSLAQEFRKFTIEYFGKQHN